MNDAEGWGCYVVIGVVVLVCWAVVWWGGLWLVR